MTDCRCWQVEGLRRRYVGGGYEFRRAFVGSGKVAFLEDVRRVILHDRLTRFSELIWLDYCLLCFPICFFLTKLGYALIIGKLFDVCILTLFSVSFLPFLQ